MRTNVALFALQLPDVDWKEWRLPIESPKTGLRFCPIFPEMRPILDNAHFAAPDGSIHCVRNYRGGESNLRSQLTRIVERAGLKMWPKVFVNLRASRRTELEERFPNHCVNEWMGHSGRVAEDHYLQITPEHWQRAATETHPSKIGGDVGGDIPANPQASRAVLDAEILGKMPQDALEFLGILMQVPPKGLEPLTR